MDAVRKLAVWCLAAAVPALPAAAESPECRAIHVIAYEHAEGARLTLEINGATLFRDLPGGSGGAATPRFLVNGENTLSASLTADDGAAARADLELFRGCEGEFPEPVGSNRNVVVALSLAGGERGEASFALDGLPESAWSRAEPAADATGLPDRVQALIAAAKARDVQAYVGFFGPMVADMAAQGMPAEQMLAGMAESVFAEMQLVDPGPLTTRPILGGRVWAVTTADGAAPLQFRGADAEFDRLDQAMYWIRTEAGWGVVRQ